MISLYLPGTSPLHRMSAGAKVLLFAVVALGIAVSSGSPWALPASWGLVIAGYLLAGFGPRTLLVQVVAVRWVLLVMLITQLLFLPVLVAASNTGRVLAVIVLASLITLTTRIPQLLDTTERALGPLRRFGVNPGAVGLLLALTITVIPVIGGFADSLREARRARGARPGLRGFVVPLLVMSLKHSDELADALTARGVE